MRRGRRPKATVYNPWIGLRKKSATGPARNRDYLSHAGSLSPMPAVTQKCGEKSTIPCKSTVRWLHRYSQRPAEMRALAVSAEGKWRSAGQQGRIDVAVGAPGLLDVADPE